MYAFREDGADQADKSGFAGGPEGALYGLGPCSHRLLIDAGPLALHHPGLAGRYTSTRRHFAYGANYLYIGQIGVFVLCA